MKNLNNVFLLLVFIGLASLSVAQTSWNYISPVPGSKYINPENNIAFRHGDVLDIGSVRSDIISVTGTERGEITGNLILSRDQRTLIFYPDQPFALKEKIHVSLEKGIRTVTGLEMEGAEFGFLIKEKDNTQMLADFYKQELQREFGNVGNQEDPGITGSVNYPGNREMQDYPPDLPLPLVTELDNPAPGKVLSTPFRIFGEIDLGYMMIVDEYGIPVFYRKNNMLRIDFKMIPGNRLAIGHGIPNTSTPFNMYLVMDSHYNIIDSLYMGNGYFVDPHDLLMLENGNHFLIAYDPQPVGMDTVVPGGNPDATVIGLVLQELDADDNVVLQWRSWDHYEITDASVHIDLTAEQIDYVHGNAVEMSLDSNLMMSQRNMDEITKIDRNTGEIIWRFGVHAKQNMFTFTNDTIGFSHQHDIRCLDNGNLTIYDNGNHHMPPFSQSLEYEIDEVGLTATKVWNYINTPVVFAPATGSSRKLENGNVIIGWGASPTVACTEVTPAKSKTYEFNFPPAFINYRAIKEEWVTDMFVTNKDTIDYGVYDDYVAWPRIFSVTNNADHAIQITSYHNHWDSYYISTPTFPVEIPAGESINVTVNFFPTMEGQINDVLTLNYQSLFMGIDTLPQCVARQVHLMGFVEDNNAPEVELDPEDGSILVPQEAIITVSFDEPVVKMGGETFKVGDLDEVLIFRQDDDSAKAVPYNAIIDAWKTKITIYPDTLYPDQNYYLELKGNMLSDGEGNAIAESVVSRFTTGEEFGIREDVLNNVRIYPNPTDDKIYLEVKEYNAEFINVLDITGRTLFTLEQPSGQTIVIDLSEQPSGVYFLEMKFRETDRPVSVKVVKRES